MLVAGSWLYVADPGGSRVVRLWADFDDDDIWKVEPEKNVRPTEQWREQYRLGYQRVTGVHAEAGLVIATVAFMATAVPRFPRQLTPVGQAGVVRSIARSKWPPAADARPPFIAI